MGEPVCADKGTGDRHFEDEGFDLWDWDRSLSVSLSSSVAGIVVVER